MTMKGWQVTISGLEANGCASVHEYMVLADSAELAVERASFLARQDREWPDALNDIFAEELDCDCDGVDDDLFGPSA